MTGFVAICFSNATKIKPFVCKEKSCNKAYSDPRSLRKHASKFHANDINNNSTTSSTSVLSSPSKRFVSCLTNTVHKLTEVESEYKTSDYLWLD